MDAERIYEAAQKAARHYGVELGALKRKEKGDMKRVSVAWAIMRGTTMNLSWIAEALEMKTAANVSQQVRRFENIPDKGLAKAVRAWRKSIFVDPELWGLACHLLTES